MIEAPRLYHIDLLQIEVKLMTSDLVDPEQPVHPCSLIRIYTVINRVFKLLATIVDSAKSTNVQNDLCVGALVIKSASVGLEWGRF